MEQSGKNLTMLGNDVWRGGATHNGTLLKLHDFSLTSGYSRLITPITPVEIPAKFGFGVWYNGTAKNNVITTIRPVGVGEVPVFAGILTRQMAIASGQPAQNDQINAYNKGLLAKEGFMIYKTGYTAGVEDLDYDDVDLGDLLCISHADGRFTFAAVCPADHTVAGVVIMLNPDDRSWTVRISVSMAGIGSAPGSVIPAGGTIGQVLAKASGDDYDVEWVDA